MSEEVEGSGRWEHVFATKDWSIYRKVRALSGATHSTTDDQSDSFAIAS